MSHPAPAAADRHDEDEAELMDASDEEAAEAIGEEEAEEGGGGAGDEDDDEEEEEEGGSSEAIIEALQGLGDFSREDVEAAVGAARGNAELAATILLEGNIPQPVVIHPGGMPGEVRRRLAAPPGSSWKVTSAPLCYPVPHKLLREARAVRACDFRVGKRALPSPFLEHIHAAAVGGQAGQDQGGGAGAAVGAHPSGGRRAAARARGGRTARRLAAARAAARPAAAGAGGQGAARAAAARLRALARLPDAPR